MKPDSIKKLAIRISDRAEEATHGARLPWALGLAIGITLLLTGISVTMYSIGGFSKVDLSRPGFEQERSEVRPNEPQKPYDTTSPITPTAIDTFLKEYDKRTKELKEIGDFNDHELEEAETQLHGQSAGSALQ